MLTLIDNYDSFTYNLVQFFGDLGAACNVIRNDAQSVDEILASQPRAIVLSPGPCTPDQAGVCVELIQRAPVDLPILGVCLGHQSIGQAFGAAVVRAPEIMHGKLSNITHNHTGLFDGLPADLRITRYHSLIVARDPLPDALRVDAETEDGLIMGLSHTERPVYGVQFHPESIASQAGHALLANFLKLAGFTVKDVTRKELEV